MSLFLARTLLKSFNMEATRQFCIGWDMGHGKSEMSKKDKNMPYIDTLDSFSFIGERS